ncbi:TolC family protein [Tamlana sp. 2_MG-2023]|uniref:TolC family protein n=1 Tax=unclassified Tamlana TaxID=2614803 RepID=UPI0026E475F3|nr:MULTISPECIES: TolC family protein [unclassified Tamlana]MDO6760400.1 TolC family protein [Tamlana sp. 2_MG-2023]MDO6789901.1 TolC family protein [Tamlana sp. 1_MG-2023]
MKDYFRNIFWLIILSLSLGVTQSCAVKAPTSGEKFQEEAFANFILPSTWQNSIDTTAVKDNWLSTFNDPILDTLVKEALVFNPDLRISSARIEEAHGYVNVAQAALRPALSILGRETTKLGGNLGGGLNGAVFSASWEIDIWGKLRNARNAAEANLAATQSEYSFAQLSIAANVTRSYFLASENYLQLQLAEQMITSSENLKTISQQRVDIGIGTEIDVVMSNANLNTLKDAHKKLELSYNNQLRALELLLGRYPHAEIAVKNQLIDINSQTPTGIPLQLLERRPDVLAAQQQFNAAFYRVGEANAAKLPSLSLTAGFGVLDSPLIQLTDDFSNPIRSIGGELIAPVYMGGQLNANVYIRTAQQKQAVENYAKTVLYAMNDVESTLDAVKIIDEREHFILEATNSNQRAFELEEIRFKVGKSDMRDLLDQQMDLYQTQTDLLHIQTQKIIQRINLFVALGGSF